MSLVSSLFSRHSPAYAAEQAVGGDFIAFGILEREALIHYGLKPDHYIIDVGCGSGRLASTLSGYVDRGKYLGIDIMPELLAHARGLVQRSDFRFALAQGTTIEEADSQADFVCFFSVFTHLYYKESYNYLTEAKRVVKPGGRIVFSFLEFCIPSHWVQFEVDLNRSTEDHPPNVFLSREAIQIWCSHLGLRIISIDDSLQDRIPLPHPLAFDNGLVMETKGSIGQTVCVLEPAVNHD